MITLKEILKESKKSESQIETIALKFRKNWERKWNWKEDKRCFKNRCQFLVDKLVEFFEENGFEAKKQAGYYKNIPLEWFKINNEDIEDRKWKHWWVIVEDEYIVDVTADQFHPNEEKMYRTEVYRKNSSEAKYHYEPI